MNEDEIIREIEEDLEEKIEDFEMDAYGQRGFFTFKSEDDGTDYEGCIDGDVAERIAREHLENYAEDCLGLKGVTLYYFDEKRFIDDCINGDGWQHEMCRYDGSNEETKNGIVYWRA